MKLLMNGIATIAFLLLTLFNSSVSLAQTSTLPKNHPNVKTESSSDDKFWYGRYVYADMDGSGKPIQSTMKYVRPTGGNVFEVQFAYSVNKSDLFPIYIYINETDGKTVLKSEWLGSLNRKVKECVVYKDDHVDLYTSNYHINVSNDGSITIFKTPNGKYANGILKAFKSNEVMGEMHKVRYKVLVEKLKQYF